MGGTQFLVGATLNPLGSKIESLLALRGLTQSELAKQLGVHPSNISALISGKQGSVKPERIPALAHALGVTADYLLDPNQTKLPSPPDNRKEAIVNVITAIEVLGWEEVARRIGETDAKKGDTKPDLIELPMPENDPEDVPPGWEKVIHKAILNSGRGTPKKRKGK